MPTKNPRVKILVPTAIAKRVREESEFLGVRSKVLMEDGRELKSIADFIRWAVDLYIEACEVGEGTEYEYEETAALDLTMDSRTRGRWAYAIKYRYAADNHQLASFALCRYFEKLDERTKADARLLRNLQGFDSARVLGYLRGGGKINDVQTSRASL